MSARRFAIDLSKWGEEQEDRADKIVRAVGLEALKGVVLASPVDTGRFRGNWQVNQSGDAPELEVEDKAGGATIAKGASEVGKQDRTRVFYIANGLPYAVRLENGWSKQAPQGMLNQTINRLRAFLGGL